MEIDKASEQKLHHTIRNCLTTHEGRGDMK